MSEGPMVPWELKCQHPAHCTAPRCGCPTVKEHKAALEREDHWHRLKGIRWNVADPIEG